jgi:hypothetical protein
VHGIPLPPKKFFIPSLDILLPKVQPEIVAALPLESGY